MLSQFHYLIGHYSLKFLHPLFIEISIFFFDKCILKKYIIVRILKFFNNRFRVFLNSCSFYIVNTSFNLLKKNKRQKIFVSKYIKKIASIIKNKNLKYTQSIIKCKKIFVHERELVLLELMNFTFSITSKRYMLHPRYGEKTFQSFQNYKIFLFSFLFCIFKKKRVVKFLTFSKRNIEISNYAILFEQIDFGNIGIIFNNLLKITIVILNLVAKIRKKNKNLFAESIINFQKYILKKSNRSPDIQITSSYMHGSGIIPLKHFERMSIIKEYRGKLIKDHDEYFLELFYNLIRQNLFFFTLDKIFVLDATYIGNSTRLMNHSCFPNCFSRLVKHGTVTL